MNLDLFSLDTNDVSEHQGKAVNYKTLLGNFGTGIYHKPGRDGWHILNTGNGYLASFKQVDAKTFKQSHKPLSTSHEPRMFVFA